MHVNLATLRFRISAFQSFAFGGDHDHTVGTFGTVDCRSRSIFEHIDRLDVSGRDVGNAIHRETIDDIERFAALGKGRTATYADLHFGIRRTFGCRHLYTGQLALQRFGHTDNGGVLQLFAGHACHRSDKVAFLGRAVTRHYHFVQHLRVLGELDIDH